VIAGNEDRMIPPEHARRVYEAFPGKKRLSIFDGTHNSNRPEKVIRECFYFIENALGLDPHPSLLSPRKKDKVAKIFIKSREKIQDVGSNEETLRIRE
jgi:PhoPQ-activated pathogenicity-related protein